MEKIYIRAFWVLLIINLKPALCEADENVINSKWLDVGVGGTSSSYLSLHSQLNIEIRKPVLSFVYDYAGVFGLYHPIIPIPAFAYTRNSLGALISKYIIHERMMILGGLGVNYGWGYNKYSVIEGGRRVPWKYNSVGAMAQLQTEFLWKYFGLGSLLKFGLYPESSYFTWNILVGFGKMPVFIKDWE